MTNWIALLQTSQKHGATNLVPKAGLQIETGAFSLAYSFSEIEEDSAQTPRISSGFSSEGHIAKSSPVKYRACPFSVH
jgi:hypothetical protein